ncbi:PIN domain-containing protein [Ideonella dechloratans]|uniref:PIN domain-containing protein n=1 Tax=Ideonella dechloratans TaxID=36863 RepID=A0A643FDP5_IDEDE|nr:PIN domain-containing protein [Ideonella dechloratans]KAB0583446.1 PIN domain-containing protein [Ideonella dechloratans]UFU09692.1 PIN domain-containing protein [Ideonella dechloratans]
MNPPASTSRPCAVIDSQSVLDWHYFDNPACRHWSESLAAGHWHWIATAAMRDELAHVLARGIPGRHAPAGQAVLAAFDRWAEIRPTPQPPLGGWPRCRDTDDQKFIDLALLGGATWLVSRDKAVLKLARRCLAQTGLVVTPPHLWSPAPSA